MHFQDPEYVGRAKAIQTAQKAVEAGDCPGQAFEEIKPVMDAIKKAFPEVDFHKGELANNIGFGSTIFAVKPGDGSAIVIFPIHFFLRYCKWMMGYTIL